MVVSLMLPFYASRNATRSFHVAIAISPQTVGNIAKKCIYVAIFEYSFPGKYGYDFGIS
jgi:hypothetical protein